jgi:hypothetical protein
MCATNRAATEDLLICFNEQQICQTKATHIHALQMGESFVYVKSKGSI